MYIPYETLLDAARLHFQRVARSPNYTRTARHQALRLLRLVEGELDAANAGLPQRTLSLAPDFTAAAAAWEGDGEPLPRAA